MSVGDESNTESDENNIELSAPEEKFLFPLPKIDSERMTKSFIVDHPNIEVTSLDITAHGCYVLAGCSNGSILLFDMSSTENSSHGYLVSQIQAKGLHTNLILSVKISQDSRFCFAGVHKGSSELQVIDLGYLPVFSLLNRQKSNKTIVQDKFPLHLIKNYNNSDAKLRGFGAVTCVGNPNLNNKSLYRLACGLGIKNVHVWQFEAPYVSNNFIPAWTFMYDVVTNGMSIESITFRYEGNSLIAKSQSVNLRCYDLSKYNYLDPNSAKPSYEDVANSQDMILSINDYSFGGTYNFAMVKIGAPKSANRDSFEMPERSLEDENGNRRKR